MSSQDLRRALNNVEEFLRQWASGGKSDDIYGILFDPEKDDLVNLYASDLRLILDAYRLKS